MRDDVQEPKLEQPQQHHHHGDKPTYRGTIVHDHAHYTNEGFGSLARNMIYPMIHIALCCNLKPYISNKLYNYNSSRPNYTTQLQSISQFLSLDDDDEQEQNDEQVDGDYNSNYMISDNDTDKATKSTKMFCKNNTKGTTRHHEGYQIIHLEINTWNDTKIGSCCGDANMIATQLNDYLNHYSVHEYQAQQKQQLQPQQICSKEKLWFRIRLVGAIRCMDPTLQVYDWLQNLYYTWKVQQEEEQKQLLNNTIEPINNNKATITSPFSTRIVRITAHVRIPEDFTSQQWKDENHIDKLYYALDIILQSLPNNRNNDNNNKNKNITIQLEVYTEKSFPMEHEQQILDRYNKTQLIHKIRIYRGTTGTLLSDIQSMVCNGTIFIPSSSHLSAFCGYVTHGMIVLSHPSRYDYFTTHTKFNHCQIIDITNIINNHDNHKDENVSSPLANDKIWQTFCDKLCN